MSDENQTTEQQNHNESETAPVSLMSSISNNSIILGLFALACTAVIAATFLSTEENINQRKREARLKALLEVVPQQRHDNDMLQDSIALFEPALGHRKQQQLFLAKQQGNAVVLIYPATARDGYSGDIDYIVGINIKDASIAGVRVLSHKETPGLGDGIDLRKSNWVLNFNGRSLANPLVKGWTVKKDGGAFDAFTGATITPRALTKSIATVLQYHHHTSQQLLLQFDSSKQTSTAIEQQTQLH